MAKEKKAKKADPKKKVEMSADEKKAIKAKLKALQAERDAAITAHDKKKIKEARGKMKRVNRELKKVLVKKEPPKEEPKAEAAAG